MNDRLSPLKFSTIYNKRGATKNTQCPDKPLHCKAFRASFTLSAAGYIASGNPTQRCDFSLGEGRLAAQTVAQANNLGFPPGEAGAYAPAYLGAGVPQVQLLQHVVVHPHHVDEREGAVFCFTIQRVGERQLTLELALRAKIHQYLICYSLLTAPYRPFLPIFQNFRYFYTMLQRSPCQQGFPGTQTHTLSQTG